MSPRYQNIRALIVEAMRMRRRAGRRAVVRGGDVFRLAAVMSASGARGRYDVALSDATRAIEAWELRCR